MARWNHILSTLAVFAAASAVAVPADVFEQFDGGARPEWSFGAGQWSVDDGALQATPSAADAASFAFVGPGEWQSDYAIRFSVRTAGAAGARYSSSGADDEACELSLDGHGHAELSQKSGGKKTVLGRGAFPGGDGWTDVEIVRQGAATTVRIDGACVFDRVAQPGLAAGHVGLFAAGGAARFDNVSVTSLPVVLFSDQFGRAGRDWKLEAGWTVNDGVLASERGGLALATPAASEPSYTCGFTVFLPAGDAAKKAGAIIDFRDAKNYSTVSLTPAGTAEYAWIVDGKSAATASGSFVGAAIGSWNDVAILRAGENTLVNVNGRRVLTLAQPGDSGVACVGLIADAGAARFDDFVLTRGLDPYKKCFPKIGGLFIGGPRKLEQPAAQMALARHDLVLLGMYAGFERGGKSPAELIREIKARNPALLVGDYSCVMESYTDPKVGRAATIAKLSAEHGPAQAPTGQPNDWWLRNAAGERVGQYPRTKMTNLTYWVQPDAEGLRYPQWYGRHIQAALHFDNTDFDFLLSDNGYAEPAMFYITPTPPDWNRDGINDPSGDPWALNFRYGMATFWMKFRQLNPTRFVFGNIGGQRHSDPLGRPEYRDLLGGALFEGFMGKRYSEETWAGWDLMMQSYRNLMEHTAPPHLVMNAGRGTAAGEAIDPKVRASFPPGYAFMRCALASTLMEDGYFSYGGDMYDVHAYLWFDEYDVQLGHAIDPPQRTPWRDGVYLRRFQNGAALVNPRNNGERTVDLAGLGFRRFRGRQDPKTNNGEPVTTLHLAAGDGIVLVRS